MKTIDAKELKFLKYQLCGTQGLIKSVLDHPIMLESMRSREDDLISKIKEIESSINNSATDS